MKLSLVPLISLLNISCVLSHYHSVTSNRKDYTDELKIIKTHRLPQKCLYCPPLPSCASVLCASGTTCVETPSTCSECGKVECKKVDRCEKDACPKTRCPKCPKGYKCAKVKGECCTNEKFCVPDCKECQEDTISTCKCKEGPGWTCEIDVENRSCWECPKQSCTSKHECKPCSNGVLPKAGSLKCPTGWYAGYPSDAKCKEGYCPTEECVKYETHEICAECLDVECGLKCIDGYECGYADSCANCMSREVCKPKKDDYQKNLTKMDAIKAEKCIDCDDNELPPAGSLKCPKRSYAGYPNQHNCPKGKCPVQECIKYVEHEMCALCFAPTECDLKCIDGYKCGYGDSCENCLSPKVCKPTTPKKTCTECIGEKLPPAGSLKCPKGSYAGYPKLHNCPKGKCPAEECTEFAVHEICALCAPTQCALECVEGYECGYADTCANCMSTEVCKPKNPEKKCIDCYDNELPPAGSLSCPEGSYSGYPKESKCPKGKCPAEECIKYVVKEACELCLVATPCSLNCIGNFHCDYSDNCANCVSNQFCKPNDIVFGP